MPCFCKDEGVSEIKLTDRGDFGILNKTDIKENLQHTTQCEQEPIVSIHEESEQKNFCGTYTDAVCRFIFVELIIECLSVANPFLTNFATNLQSQRIYMLDGQWHLKGRCYIVFMERVVALLSN